MRRSKFTEEQIAFALRQGDLGTAVAEVCRKMGVSEATYFRWKQKYGGLGPEVVPATTPADAGRHRQVTKKARSCSESVSGSEFRF